MEMVLECDAIARAGARLDAARSRQIAAQIDLEAVDSHAISAGLDAVPKLIHDMDAGAV